MSEQKKSERAKEKLRCSTGPVHIESTSGANENGEIISVPHLATLAPQDVHGAATAAHVAAQVAPEEPPRDSLESEIQAVEAALAIGLTDKVSHATMPGASELAGVVGDSNAHDEKLADVGVNSNAHDEKLADVVADPYAEEHQWYAACVAAGHRCLAGLPSPLRVAMVRTAAVVGVVFSFLSILACYTSSMYLSSHIGSMGLGLNNNLFINDLVGLDYVGFFVAGAACLTFWSAFFGFFKRTFRYASIALFVGIMVHSVNFHLLVGVPAAVALAVAYVPVLYLVEWVGGAIREALPLHIGSKKLARILLPSVAFPALLMAVSLLYIFSPLNPPGNTDYDPATAPTLAINAVLVLLCTFVPGFVLARGTKSKSAIGSASLSILLQTPVLIGLLLTIGACLVLQFVFKSALAAQPSFAFLAGMGGGDWAQYGGTKALAVLGAIAFAALAASGGGALGAWLNNKFGVKSDEKPLPAELR